MRTYLHALREANQHLLPLLLAGKVRSAGCRGSIAHSKHHSQYVAALVACTEAVHGGECCWPLRRMNLLNSLASVIAWPGKMYSVKLAQPQTLCEGWNGSATKMIYGDGQAASGGPACNLRRRDGSSMHSHTPMHTAYAAGVHCLVVCIALPEGAIWAVVVLCFGQCDVLELVSSFHPCEAFLQLCLPPGPTDSHSHITS